MSWLNLNDSLNQIKGQLTTFASNVLTDGIVQEDGSESGATDPNSRTTHLETEYVLKDAQIAALKAQNEELLIKLGKSSRNASSAEDNWSWDPPPDPKTVAADPTQNALEETEGLKRKIAELEEEKRDLASSLEQLDVDCQQTTDKLVTLKDSLQIELQQVKSALDKCSKEKEKLAGKRDDAASTVEALKEELKNVREDLRTKSNLDKEFDMYKKDKEIELKLVKQELEKYRKDKRAQEDFLNEHQSVLGQLEERNRAIEAEREKLKTYMKTFEKLQEEHESLQRKYKELETGKSLHQELHEQMASVTESNPLRFTADNHNKYAASLTEIMNRVMADAELPTEISLERGEDEALNEFNAVAELYLKMMLDFRLKAEALEKKIMDKSRIISEKNYEIEKLLRNSEILSEEVLSKSEAMQQYEAECTELIKNNEILLGELQNYRTNGDKSLSSLQTISESNEDNLLLLESQLECANVRIRELEQTIGDQLEERNLEQQTELEYIKKQLNMTGKELSQSKKECQEMAMKAKQAEVDASVARNELSKFRTSYDVCFGEKQDLKSQLEKLKLELENMEYKWTEIQVEQETTKEEMEKHVRTEDDLAKSCKKLSDTLESAEARVENLVQEINNLNAQLCTKEENAEQKDVQIRQLEEKLQSAKMSETGFKLQLDQLHKELNSVAELKQSCEVKLEEREKFVESLRSENVSLKERENGAAKLIEMEKENADLKSDLQRAVHEKNHLSEEIQNRYQENVQYYNEIQRLNVVLQEQTEKVTILTQRLASKELEALAASSASQSSSVSLTEEVEKLTDQNGFLKEKCDVLTGSLLQEQQAKEKAQERETALGKELERLRIHLVEIEDTYTQELVQAEQRCQEMQTKVNEAEQREKNSSTIYTSVSIRANQQVETLQTQLALVTVQRDEIQRRVSEDDDRINKQQAALTNLQVVLDKFKRDRDSDIREATAKIRRQMELEKSKQQDLLKEMDTLKQQLEESKQGLQAASRLSSQLEKSKRETVSLKEEVTKLQEKLRKSEETLRKVTSHTDTKVDKTLIKNLIIGFASHIPSGLSKDQNQILRIIGTVLDFSAEDNEKVRLNKDQGGWLNSLLHPNAASQQGPNVSLTAAFVRFLESESQPKKFPSLLEAAGGSGGDGGSASSSRKSSVSGPPPHNRPIVMGEVVLPTFADFAPSKNTSAILKDVLKET